MSSLLSAADIAYMQDTQNTAMPGTVVIERYMTTPNGMGGSYEDWAAAGTVSGRIYPIVRRGMAEAEGGAQVVSDTRWVGTFPDGTIIYVQDRLVWDGRSWEVTSTNQSEMWKTAVRVELESLNIERRT
jgi:hypothetical protein